ncbi:N-acetylmuramoyl-L-alanine amidase family protein [Formosa sp. 3Alg 14/1]|uniref:N-acetylmuramoyl-L-alanine amidase family protein n=1 Tax=Formosa sp. 3Alg 14/1 TaxID=3382190 RepID=UPI0039BE8DE1
MKHKTIHIVIVFSMLSSIVFGQVVIIDPGHGGMDSGAVGNHQQKLEKDIVLAIAKAMIEENRMDETSGLEMYLTRYTDTLIALKDRTRLAKELKPMLFLSLHCNNATHENANGVEVYAYSKSGRFKANAVYWGYVLEKQLTQFKNLESRGVKFENFHVLRNLVNDTPSVLLELGFLSNPDDETYLSSKKGIHQIALKINQTINSNLKK